MPPGGLDALYKIELKNMGLALYLIIVTNAATIQVNDVPSRLGFIDVSAKGTIGFHLAQSPGPMAVSKYGNNLLITHWDLVFKLFDQAPTAMEQSLSTAFPNSEIAIFILSKHSYQYAYSIIRDGKCIRAKHGSEESKYLDFGELLPEEQQLADEKLFAAEELRQMRKEMSDKEIAHLTELERGYRITQLLTKRYLGKEFTELDEVMMTEFDE